MNTNLLKNNIRKQILAKRASLNPDFIHSYEVSALERLLQCNAFHSAKQIMLYMDFRNEAPTKLLIEASLEAGKKLVLPYTDTNFHIIPFEIPNLGLSRQGSLIPCLQHYLKQSPMGILEPNTMLCPEANPLEIDLILVPGVAFDTQGNRLGYGKGCYDEFLPKLRPDALKLGLAYDFQILEYLPHEPRDWKVDGLL